MTDDDLGPTALPLAGAHKPTHDFTDGHESVDAADEGTAQLHDAAKPRKRKKKKSKKTKKVDDVLFLPFSAQTDPPTLPISRFFAPDSYPVGEISDYRDSNSYRITSEEKRHLERADHEDNYNAIRRAAEVHRQVRQYARRKIKPGMTMMEIADLIEKTSTTLNEAEGLTRGIAFPTGLSLNHVAAHYTPNPGDSIVLKGTDVLKVDIGVHVNGRIVDSAYTMNFEPTYDRLLEAVKDATNTGVGEAGIDVRVRDIGKAIQEVMESYEVEINDNDGQQVLPVKAIRDLCGHDILPYTIHGSGKSVPSVVKGNETDIMEEGECFAIETFGSTGRGILHDEGATSHFALTPGREHRPLRFQGAKTLLQTIQREFGTLPFCRRYLDQVGETRHILSLKHLVDNGIVRGYPPLADVKGSMTAQFEHTIILRPTCKEVVSRGDDY